MSLDAEPQKEGIQRRQQLSWYKMTENKTFEKDPTPTSFEIPPVQRGWTCYMKRRKEILARAHKQQCHDGQKLRASKGFFAKLHAHAAAIARKSNIQRMDKRRRQIGAEYGHDKNNHIASPAKENMETDVVLHSVQKARRRDCCTDIQMVERREQTIRGTKGEGSQGAQAVTM